MINLLNFITENFKSPFTFKWNRYGELFGTILDEDYCLNFRYDEQENKVEMRLYTPFQVCFFDYKGEQGYIFNRIEKSKLVERVVKIGKKRIDIYLK